MSPFPRNGRSSILCRQNGQQLVICGGPGLSGFCTSQLDVHERIYVLIKRRKNRINLYIDTQTFSKGDIYNISNGSSQSMAPQMVHWNAHFMIPPILLIYWFPGWLFNINSSIMALLDGDEQLRQCLALCSTHTRQPSRQIFPVCSSRSPPSPNPHRPVVVLCPHTVIICRNYSIGQQSIASVVKRFGE